MGDRVMKRALTDAWKSLVRLLSFLAWYGAAVAVLLYLLPAAGLVLEQHYDTLNSTVKFFSIIGILGVIGVWQAVNMRNRQ
jgi:hypothetical protein